MRVLLIGAMLCVAMAVHQEFAANPEVQELGDNSDPAGEAKAECLAKTQAQMKAHCISKTTAAQCGWATAANMHDW